MLRIGRGFFIPSWDFLFKCLTSVHLWMQYGWQLESPLNWSIAPDMDRKVLSNFLLTGLPSLTPSRLICQVHFKYIAHIVGTMKPKNSREKK